MIYKKQLSDLLNTVRRLQEELTSILEPGFVHQSLSEFIVEMPRQILRGEALNLLDNEFLEPPPDAPTESNASTQLTGSTPPAKARPSCAHRQWPRDRSLLCGAWIAGQFGCAEIKLVKSYARSEK